MATRSEQIETAVSLLEKLVTMRFPDPNPDLFTLRDFNVRYPLTKLGPVAIEAMEKSQRINRQQHNYTNMGLCEFHIGLIYLSNEDCLGALQHFSNAQHQWTFVKEPSGMGLAHFAQGFAQKFNWQYEAALASFSRIRQWLPRIELDIPAGEQSPFFELLKQSFEEAQLELRTYIWPEPDGVPRNNLPQEEPAPQNIQEPPQPPSSPTLTITPNPEAVTPHEEQIASSPVLNIKPAPPMVRFDTGMGSGIVPGHTHTDPNYAWYLIMSDSKPDFFPVEVEEGSWVLVYKRKQDGLRRGELVIVGHQDDRLLDESAVRVQPVLGLSPYPILTIAWLEHLIKKQNEKPEQANQPIEEADLTTSPEMRLIPTKMKDIIGVVVGFWHPVQIQQ